MTSAALTEIADRNAVLGALTALVESGQVFELRALHATTAADRYPRTWSGYFDDAGKAAIAVDVLRSFRGMYLTINPVNADLFARAANRLRPMGKGDAATADHDVTARRYIPVDLDPVRPSGISSTDGEHAAALERAERIVEDLANEGLPLPVSIDTGNGALLLYRVDLPAADGGLVASVLSGLDQRYSDGVVKVDTGVHNAARICRAPGTMNCKGDDVPGRPHRMAVLLSAPEELEVVTVEQLQAMATVAKLPLQVHGQPMPNWHGRPAGDGPAIDLAEWIARHGLDVTGPEPWSHRGGAGQRWVFRTCPWNPDHTDGSAWVAQMASGALAAGCHHNGCQGLTWADLRSMFDSPAPVANGYRRGTAKPVPETPADDEAADADQAVPASEVTVGSTPNLHTDLANARRLVAAFDGRARWNHSRGLWIVYVNGVWAEDTAGQVEQSAKGVADAMWTGIAGFYPAARKAAIRHATRASSAAGIGAMISLSRSEPGIAITADQLDANPWALNVANGVVDLLTGNLRPHDPTELHARQAPAAYEPSASCPTFLAFIDRIMAGNADLIGYVQRLCGILVTGDVTEQVLPLFIGVGANGKSVLVDTLLGMLGTYAGLAPPSLLTDRGGGEEHPTELADLIGRRLVVGSETEESARLKVQLVKRLTGEATVKARFMRCDYFEARRTFKVLLVTNNKPVVTEAGNAIWRRLRLVPFGVVIPDAEQDRNLLDKLKTEWPGIMAWCIRGTLDWRRGGMRTPEAVQLATAEYKAEQDVLADYVTARTVRGGDNVKVGRSELWADYQSWASQVGERHPLARNTFYDRVRKLPGVLEDQWRSVGITSPVRGFRKIGLAHIGDL